jgi:hypothetical protein
MDKIKANFFDCCQYNGSAIHRFSRDGALVGLAAPLRKGLRSKFHTLLHRCRTRTSLRVVALGQSLRRFADHITATVGEEHGERVQNWFGDKKSGWYAVLEDPKIPAMSTLLDQAHNAIVSVRGSHDLKMDRSHRMLIE